MRNPLFSRIGTVLCLSAWIFGAFLLGIGNAYFGISGDVRRSAAQTVARNANQSTYGICFIQKA
jgi:hypothetical protein